MRKKWKFPLLFSLIGWAKNWNVTWGFQIRHLFSELCEHKTNNTISERICPLYFAPRLLLGCPLVAPGLRCPRGCLKLPLVGPVVAKQKKLQHKFWAYEATKGQMKSECTYEIIDFPKYHQKNLKDFCPESLFRLGMLSTHLSRVALRIIKTNHMYLPSRAEIYQIFLVVCCKIDDFINTFWLHLTFN